ncbi:MAG: NAD-dependent dihydropyrimidine dehydrogenase subunit PreA [Spirochaetaceae bacterium]|jgi:dihydropyrimidine dehydrogenase (NAD+) subunit PreA|nr:NAD-dependent dihydropyrimidine dehydrogenase subunit PreA [Spirochaetaceae bacterium]
MTAERYSDPVEEASRCLLCHDPPCNAACKRGSDPAAFIRGVRFGLGASALSSVADCADCKSCEKACIHYDFPLRITELRRMLEPGGGPRSGEEMRGALRGGIPPLRGEAEDPRSGAVARGEISPPSLEIEFCGLKCENPFFLSSSIVAADYAMCARALDMGWAGIVYKTIGYGEIRDVSPRFDSIGKERTPFIGFRNLEQISSRPAADNFADLARLKRDFPGKVIAASIMGQNEAEWTALAAESERAGVDMIECNFSCPHMSESGLGSDVGQDPRLVAAFTRAVRRGSGLPVLAKMTPNLASVIPSAEAALCAGADGIAAINTVKSFTGFDAETERALMDVNGRACVSGYSGKAVKPIALRFVSEIKTWPGTRDAPVSGMGGIETWRDAVDFILLGCGNVQVTTAVMQYGARIIDPLLRGLADYMTRQGIASITGLVGRGLGVFAPANELDRVSIASVVHHGEKCLGCGRCYISCRDAGHGAVSWDGERRLPLIDSARCAGCHLCLQVCPAEGALGAGERVMSNSTFSVELPYPSVRFHEKTVG